MTAGGQSFDSTINLSNSWLVHDLFDMLFTPFLPVHMIIFPINNSNKIIASNCYISFRIILTYSYKFVSNFGTFYLSYRPNGMILSSCFSFYRKIKWVSLISAGTSAYNLSPSDLPSSGNLFIFSVFTWMEDSFLLFTNWVWIFFLIFDNLRQYSRIYFRGNIIQQYLSFKASFQKELWFVLWYNKRNESPLFYFGCWFIFC